MLQWTSLLSALVLTAALFFWSADVRAQQDRVSVDAGTTHEQHNEQGEGNWEGSTQGSAYSEFNHRFAGLFVLLFGLAELGHGLRYQLPFWTRLVLPGALGVIGAYLLIWSDHEAWPIGSLSFVQTFFGQDQEILQHKFYGVFGSMAAVSEMLRRMGWARHPAWATPLIFFGLIGGLLLFVHSHGSHPTNDNIDLRHALLGGLGVCASVSKAVASWMPGVSRYPANRWELAWAVFVVLIGLQLLVYFE